MLRATPRAVAARRTPLPLPASRRSVLAGLQRALEPRLLPNHYPPLHGLRVLGIVLVVQLHATAALQQLKVISFSTDLLWFGMDLFFFLSGFLIGSMLLVESRSGQRVGILRFYLRRGFRIVPPYVIVLSLLAASPWWVASRANLWLEYLYLTNYVQPTGAVVMPWAWSLAVEEHFYLIVPALVLALRSLGSQRAQLLVLVLLWLSGLLLRAGTFAWGGPWDPMRMVGVFYFQSHLRYDILVAGIITGYVQHYYRDALVLRLRHALTRQLLAGTTALFLGLILLQPILAPVSATYALLCWGTFTSLAYVPLVLLLLNHDGPVSRMLSQRVFVRIATFGYGIYLIHVPLIWLVVLPCGALIAPWAQLSPLQSWAFVVCAALGVSTFGGYALHLAIEKPMLRLRDRLSP